MIVEEQDPLTGDIFCSCDFDCHFKHAGPPVRTLESFQPGMTFPGEMIRQNTNTPLLAQCHCNRINQPDRPCPGSRHRNDCIDSLNPSDHIRGTNYLRDNRLIPFVRNPVEQPANPDAFLNLR